MKIRQGTVADSAVVEEVMKQAVRRIQATGSDQWGHILAGEETAIIAARLKAGEVYLYEDGQQVVGVFYLYEAPNDWDYELWQEEQQVGIYYLHRLSLADDYTGQGMADKLLKALQTRLNEQSANKVVRLDCIATQGVLNKLYTRNAFQHVKQVKNLVAGPITADFNLYQWHVSN